MSPFLTAIFQIIDAYDSYGTFRKLSGEQKLARSFLLTEEEKENMEACGTIDEKYRAQITLFFQAMALTIEQRTGKMVSSLVEMNDEGFGQAILYSGRLVILSKGLRGTQQFGFTDMERANKLGEKNIAAAIALIERYPEIANLD